MPKLTRYFFLGLVSFSSLQAEDTLSYNQHVKPILSDKCFLCHGPDVANNKADLRLDLEESAYSTLKDSIEKAIVPGDSSKSVAYHRMISSDPEQIMPPPESNLKMTPKEIETIKKWIDQGAEYEPHWAFTNLPKSIALPKVHNSNWPKQEIDTFILSRLEKEELTPAKEASPLRWLRRATFDLTGLPPTPEEINAFEKNPNYEAAVNRLLASPAYGEHMAKDWLDAARYADSYGYQSDKLNTQWPYRDWVIRAFNDNLPYDDFIIWQLAGDLLENPTRDQKLATAFNRIHRLNNEGGAIFEEWRTENIADRVHTYGTAMLGLTMECTRCHDHKYDPITARDYFSLFAFFNSIDENGMYDRTERVPSPTMLLPTPEQEQALADAKAAYEQKKAENLDLSLLNRMSEWRKSSPKPIISDQLIHLDFNSGQQKNWHFAENDHGKTSPLEFVPTSSDTPNEKAVSFDGDRGISVHDIESFDRWTPFTVSIRFKESSRSKGRAVIAHHTRGTDAGYNGWDLTIIDGYVESRMYRIWPGNAMGVRTKKPIPSDQFHLLTASYDASDQASGLRLYLDGEQLETEILRDEKLKSSNIATQHGGKFALGFRFRDRGLAGALIDDLKIHSRALTSLEILHIAGKLLLKDLIKNPTHEIEDTINYYASSVDKQHRAYTAAIHAALKDFVMTEEVMNEIPIMKELPEQRPSYILARGEYDAPKTEENKVGRDTFEHILPRFDDSYSDNRLGLAKWTTQPDHPLTSRVFINRIWAQFFGQGLVDTPENFGFQGSLPSHPKLLDWLSRDFVDNGWDIKRLCKKIVLSASYRQESSASKQLVDNDPTNTLLARGPAYRLAAEQIRDLALAASGLMNRTMCGPPVSPYQPGKDLWRESNGMSPPYKQDVGRSLYRRSLYSVWKRTAPLPNMMAFDATTREVCAVARSRTNTPLQALVLLNDIQFVEAARALAEKSMKQSSDHSEQVDYAFTSLASRSLDKTEKDVLVELLESQITHYSGKLDEAKKLTSHGDTAPDPSLNSAHLAALTTVCQAILSLDATIWKR